MTFSKDTTLTDAPRLARRFVLVWILTAPLIGPAALDTPQRPATTLAARTVPSYPPERSERSGSGHPRTYLALAGPSALRFAEADPVLPAEPSLPAPKSPKTPLPPEASISSSASHQPPETTRSEPAKVSDVPPESAGDNVKPVSILPDDTRVEIKPEDVLPFFQFPNGNDGSTVAIPLTVSPRPAGNPVPPSSATYRQQ